MKYSQEILDILNHHEEVDVAGLSPQQAQFVEHYVRHLQPARAAQAAGYSPAYAAQLLRLAPIQSAIAARRERLQRYCPVVPHDIAAELQELAFASLGDVGDLQPDGKFLLKPGLTRQDLKAVRKITTKTTSRMTEEGIVDETTLTVEMYNKIDASRALSEIMGYSQNPENFKETNVDHGQQAIPDFSQWPADVAEKLYSLVRQEHAKTITPETTVAPIEVEHRPITKGEDDEAEPTKSGGTA